MKTKGALIVACISFAVLTTTASAQQSGGANMSFFVTSAGSGKGADLGGLEGADRHCQELAAKAGAGSRSWRAYLSTQGVDDLHGASNKISKQTALTETGEPVKGRGDTPNMHDILTGSQADGRAFPGADDMTCRNWTSAEAGAAMVGHHDRMGLRDDEPSKSWNTSHPSRGPNGGCSQDALRGTGGAGLFYCFAAN
jgi:hypothetical protein